MPRAGRRFRGTRPGGPPLETVLIDGDLELRGIGDAMRDIGKIGTIVRPASGTGAARPPAGRANGRAAGRRRTWSDPGYLRWDAGPAPDGTVLLGALPHADLIARMRRALCLFYPQTTFAETFGLVLAEANAVGTPVLVHPGLGANDEVVRGSGQAVHGRDVDAQLERILRWRADPPRVTVHPEFRLARVAERWREVLAALAATGWPTRRGRGDAPAAPARHADLDA